MARFRSASSKTIVWRLAAEFQRNLLQISGRRLHDQLADFGRSGERNLVHVGMRGESSARRFAVSGDNVHHAFGESGFLDQFAQPQRGERGLFCGFQNHGATGGQRRSELPCGHQQREVPGNDLPNDADRLAQRVRRNLRRR